jgi:hypothetical protein
VSDLMEHRWIRDCRIELWTLMSFHTKMGKWQAPIAQPLQIVQGEFVDLEEEEGEVVEEYNDEEVEEVGEDEEAELEEDDEE